MGHLRRSVREEPDGNSGLIEHLDRARMETAHTELNSLLVHPPFDDDDVNVANRFRRGPAAHAGRGGFEMSRRQTADASRRVLTSVFEIGFSRLAIGMRGNVDGITIMAIGPRDLDGYLATAADATSSSMILPIGKPAAGSLSRAA